MNWRSALAALIALVLASAGASAEPSFSFDATPGKLPKSVVPTRYAVELAPDLQSLSIAGSEVVDVDVREGVARVVLSAVNIEITEASLDGGAKPAQVSLDAAAETATLDFGSVIAPGAHKLRLAFTAKINSFGRGLFFVDYPTEAGTKRMISTQLEPADARRIFPCWDEPVFKATFALTVTVPLDFLAVSNTPVTKEEAAASDKKRVSFATTPKMSSYLFVLSAGELERITADADGVTVGVVATRG